MLEKILSVILGRVLTVKNAYFQSNINSRVCTIRSRVFGYESSSSNIPSIFRKVVEGAASGASLAFGGVARSTTTPTLKKAQIKAVTTVMRAAQLKAALWGMDEVSIWNPCLNPIVEVRCIEAFSQVMHRDEDSIACLRRHSSGPEANILVVWIRNKTCGWY